MCSDYSWIFEHALRLETSTFNELNTFFLKVHQTEAPKSWRHALTCYVSHAIADQLLQEHILRTDPSLMHNPEVLLNAVTVDVEIPKGVDAEDVLLLYYQLFQGRMRLYTEHCRYQQDAAVSLFHKPKDTTSLSSVVPGWLRVRVFWGPPSSYEKERFLSCYVPETPRTEPSPRPCPPVSECVTILQFMQSSRYLKTLLS